MSYYTRMELNWDDGGYAAGSLSADDVLQAARPFVETNDWGVDDVLADLKESVSGGGLDRPGYNRISAFDLIAMIETVSRAFPQVTFYARGVGEDYFDIWARQYRDGNVLMESRPIDPEGR